MVIANVRRLVVRHLGKAGSAAHGAPQQGLVFLSWHLANMRPGPVIFLRGTLPQSNHPLGRPIAGLERVAGARGICGQMCRSISAAAWLARADSRGGPLKDLARLTGGIENLPRWCEFTAQKDRLACVAAMN